MMLFSSFLTAQSDSPRANFANLSRYRAANEALPPPRTDEQRIVLLGNSITEGWARQDPDFFTDNKLIGRGISGQTSPQLLLRFRQDVIELKPAAVVIHIGTNDVAENTGPYDADFTMGNIQSMVELARANDIAVILAAVLPATGFGWRPELGDRSDEIVALNQRLKEYAAEEGIPFVDYHAALANEANGMDAELAKDGVHPTPAGYRIMADLIRPVIERVRSEP
jgi:lysophospholipase L1-like esterase